VTREAESTEIWAGTLAWGEIGVLGRRAGGGELGLGHTMVAPDHIKVRGKNWKFDIFLHPFFLI